MYKKKQVDTTTEVIVVCSYCHKTIDNWGAERKLVLKTKLKRSSEVSHGICRKCLRAYFYNEYLALLQEGRLDSGYVVK